MRGNRTVPIWLARHFARAQPLYLAVPADLSAGASAALHGLPVVTTTGGAARLASAPSPCQRGSREILRQALDLSRTVMIPRQHPLPSAVLRRRPRETNLEGVFAVNPCTCSAFNSTWSGGPR